MNNFLLEKWYLDVCQNESSAIIAYGARLKYRKVRMSYSGFTLLNDGKLSRNYSFRAQPLPHLRGSDVVWETAFLKGEWDAQEFPLRRVLLEDRNHRIDWDCLVPKAKCSVTAAGKKMTGFGYAEKMTLSFLPWELPIRELQWGRFLSTNYSLIWIKWTGPVMKSMIFFNGEETTGSISPFNLEFAGYSLWLKDSLTMRAGTVGSNVFNGFSVLSRFFPASILQLKEHKWVSFGKLCYDGKPVDTGHAIHEVVIWK